MTARLLRMKIYSLEEAGPMSSAFPVGLSFSIPPFTLLMFLGKRLPEGRR
jgi:hypothetical protein